MNIEKHRSQPGIELSPPETIEAPMGEFLEEQKDIAPFSSEKESKTVELAPALTPIDPSKSATKVAPKDPPPLAPINDSGAQSTSILEGDVPSEAADIDIIEKIWVAKAKELIDKTKDDPHTQKAQMSKFKAEYIKKRINKDIKISED